MSSMIRREVRALLAAAVVGCGLVSGCLSQGEPSPAYREATDAFNALYGRELEDAYVSPEMAAIEAQLESVPTDSSDHQRAAELLKRIRSGRERVESIRAEREAAIADALAPSKDIAFSDTAVPKPAEPVDAGSPVPTEGMKLAEFNARFSECFVSSDPVLLNEKGMRPTWLLKDQPACRERFAGFETKILVGQDDAIYVIADRSKVEIREADGGVPGKPTPAN